VSGTGIAELEVQSLRLLAALVQASLRYSDVRTAVDAWAAASPAHALHAYALLQCNSVLSRLGTLTARGARVCTRRAARRVGDVPRCVSSRAV
jgi:hypothetical protein